MAAGRIQVRVPADLWDPADTEEGVIANWFCEDGGVVEQGDTVAEVAVEKSTYDITAPATGRITIAVPKDGVVQPGTVIGRIDAR